MPSRANWVVRVLRRVAGYVVLTIVATTLAYATASITLDPAAAYQTHRPRLSDATIAAELDRLNANPDVPLTRRTWRWATQILLHGDFGLNSRFEPVTHDLFVRSFVSLQLLVIGSLLGAALGVALGAWGAMRQYRPIDHVTTFTSYLVLATPIFVLGFVLMNLATSLNTAIGATTIAFTGPYSPDVEGFWPQVADRASHLVLPTIVLTMVGAAQFSRYQRHAMLDVLSADYVRTARAKGRTRSSAVLRHGLRVALIPMSTFFAFSFGTLVAGSTLLELVFGWHGMGELAVTAIADNDVNSAAAVVCYVSVLVLVSATLAEMLHTVLDPRSRV